jgi:hypothetical protein
MSLEEKKEEYDAICDGMDPSVFDTNNKETIRAEFLRSKLFIHRHDYRNGIIIGIIFGLMLFFLGIALFLPRHIAE